MTRTAIATFMQICRIIVLIMVQMTIVASVSFYLAIKYSLNFCCSPSKPNVMGSPQIVVESSTMHWLMIWHSFNFHAIEAFHNYSCNSPQWKHGLFDLSNQLRKVFLRLELVLSGIRADSDLVKLCREKELQDGLPHPKLLTMNHHYVTRGKTTEATNASLMQISTVGRVHPYNGPRSQMGKCKRTLGIKMCDKKKLPPPSQFSHSHILN